MPVVLGGTVIVWLVTAPLTQEPAVTVGVPGVVCTTFLASHLTMASPGTLLIVIGSAVTVRLVSDCPGRLMVQVALLNSFPALDASWMLRFTDAPGVVTDHWNWAVPSAPLVTVAVEPVAPAGRSQVKVEAGVIVVVNDQPDWG